MAVLVVQHPLSMGEDTVRLCMQVPHPPQPTNRMCMDLSMICRPTGEQGLGTEYSTSTAMLVDPN